MSRQFKSTDTVKWVYGFGRGAYDASIGNEEHSWNGSTRFQANGAITGTAGQTSFVKPSGWGHRGLCLLHQTQGSGAGNWELAFVDFSGASAVSDKPLQNTYSSGAQIITLSNSFVGYRNVTISGTLTTPAWNGSTGGICAILASGTVNITGAVSAEGKGYRGGAVDTHNGGWGGLGGEGNAGYSGKGAWDNQENGRAPSGAGHGGPNNWGYGQAGSTDYTGGGGGGGADKNNDDESAGGGGGGGHYYGGGGGGAGTDSNGAGGVGGAADAVGGGSGGGRYAGSGNYINDPGNVSGRATSNVSGTGGNGQPGAACIGGGGGGGANAVYSNSQLVKMFMGGGGGAGGNFAGAAASGNSDGSNNGGAGGSGAGIIIIIARSIIGSGYLLSRGTAGATYAARGGGGGGGAGGSILLKAQTATLGSGLVLATGGGSGAPQHGGDGGYGSQGIIHLDYSQSYSGSTSPTLDVTQDKSIYEPYLLGGMI